MKSPKALITATFLAFCSASAITTVAAPQSIKVQIKTISPKGIGNNIGTLLFTQRKQKLEIKPQISGLTPGAHAMHIHENGSCASSRIDGVTIPGGAAGGHYHGTTHHQHTHHSSAHSQRPAGDLPELIVNAQGNATSLIHSNRLMLHELKGRSVVIHAESEQSGGGDRIACGVIL